MHTLFSQKNKDKYNEVTSGFLNIVSRWRSIPLTPPFSTPVVYSRIFHSCIFHPCYLLLLFPLLHFPPLQFWPYRIFHSGIFSRPLDDSEREVGHSPPNKCPGQSSSCTSESLSINASSPAGQTFPGRCKSGCFALLLTDRLNNELSKRVKCIK